MTTEEKIKSKIYILTSRHDLKTKYLNVWVGITTDKYMQFSVISSVDKSDEEMIASLRKNVETFYRMNPDVKHLFGMKDNVSGSYIVLSSRDLGPLVKPITQVEMVKYIRENGGAL